MRYFDFRLAPSPTKVRLFITEKELDIPTVEVNLREGEHKTSEFLEKMTGDQQKDSQLIGQFGVGFYSSFIVAERVEVHTRKAGDDAGDGILWESHGESEFSVEPRPREQRGTTITLYLKEDCGDERPHAPVATATKSAVMDSRSNWSKPTLPTTCSATGRAQRVVARHATVRGEVGTAEPR